MNKFCIKCGAERVKDTQFCIKCGAKFDYNKKPQHTTPKKEDKTVKSTIVEDSSTNKCPKCGLEVYHNSTFCVKCRQK